MKNITLITCLLFLCGCTVGPQINNKNGTVIINVKEGSTLTQAPQRPAPAPSPKPLPPVVYRPAPTPPPQPPAPVLTNRLLTNTTTIVRDNLVETKTDVNPWGAPTNKPIISEVTIEIDETTTTIDRRYIIK